MRLQKAILAALLLVPVTATAQGQPTSEAACAELTRLAIPGLDLEITRTQWFPAGSQPPALRPGMPPPAFKLPAYCRIDGVLDRRTGADGKPYGIGFALALPAEWNGRFLFQGGGGLNGTVQLPLGATAAGDTPALARGFAVASTDSGHSGQVFDAGFMAEQQASLDFAYQAVPRVTQLAKEIIARHYGRAVGHSYFTGCSTGGREAMLMTQRYPTYFDGVVSGAPAMRTAYSGIGDEWVATMLNTVAPKDASGHANPRAALSDAQKQAVMDGLLAACDEGDGLKDGMIFNTTACRFDPTALVCSADKGPGCLTPEQASAIAKGFAGPKDSTGRQVYPGFPYDTGITATQGIPGLLHGGMNPVGPPFSSTSMDVDARAAQAASNAANVLTATSSWTLLNTFSNHGGKLIFFHGMSDPWFSALDTVDYYQRMTKANGGAEKVMDWSRLYLVPGMGHCAGGAATVDSFDLLSAVVDWVEKDTAPEGVTASGRGPNAVSRPLCPYPQHAQYKGQGDPSSAASFECRQ
jgi:Tannase and feruloyl esterase